MQEHFGDVFNEYMKAQRRNPGQLAKLTGIPRQTIISWKNGTVKRPQRILDILRLAQALHLDRSQVNRLLRAANHEPVEQLAEQDHSGQQGNSRSA